MVDEQTNDLLLKNYNLRPTRSTAVPKAYVGSNRSFDHFRSHGAGKVEIFGQVAIDPAQIIEITFGNKMITLE